MNVRIIVIAAIALLLGIFGFAMFAGSPSNKIDVFLTGDCPGVIQHQDGKFLGTEYDLLRAVEKKLQAKKYSFNYQLCNFDVLMSKVNGKPNTVGAGCLSKTADREKNVSFSKTTMNVNTVVISHKNSTNNFIGVQVGYSHLEKIKSIAAKEKKEIKLFDDLSIMVAQFLEGAVSSIALDDVVATNVIAKKLFDTNKIVMKKIDGTATPISFILNKDPASKTLNDDFNQALEEVMAESKKACKEKNESACKTENKIKENKEEKKVVPVKEVNKKNAVAPSNNNGPKEKKQ